MAKAAAPILGPTKSTEALAACSIPTPPAIVRLMWRLVQEVCPDKGTCLDLGAGDCRFARQGHFASYLGIDVQPVSPDLKLPKDARFSQQCVSKVSGKFDLVIGNPPYLRNHEIDPTWRDTQRLAIERETGILIPLLANLYVYFIAKAIHLVKEGGVICLLVPSDWLGRPSAKPIVDYLVKKEYRVDVFQLHAPRGAFPDVYTTACILRIRTAERRHGIQVFDINTTTASWAKSRPTMAPTSALNGNRIPFDRRGPIYAYRGFSPGSQEVFCLTEDERKDAGIPRDSVVPAITSLRPLPHRALLDSAAWRKYYRNAGERCWLLVTDPKPHKKVLAWLARHTEAMNENWTCSSRDPWYSYPLPSIPSLVYSTGFKGQRPQIARNLAKARILGSVGGIHVPEYVEESALVAYLRKLELASRVIPLAKGFRKIEVRQMNALLNAHLENQNRSRSSTNGTSRSP